MSSRINAIRQPAVRPTSTDFGPAFLNAVRSIGPNTDNGTIDQLAASITSRLQAAGVRDTNWVREMLYQVRGTHQGVPGDKTRFLANVDKASRLGLIGPNGRAQLRSAAGAAAEAYGDRSREETNNNSILSRNPRQRQPKQDTFATPVWADGTNHPAQTRGGPPLRGAQSQQANPAQSNRVGGATQPKKAEVATPRLDAVIDSLDKTIKAMPDGTIKSSLATVKSSLELARTAQKNGDTVAYTKAIGGLSENVFKTVGEIVKSFGQNGALASQAAEQLGKVAGFLGKGVKVVSAVEDLSKVLRGKTLSGAAVSKEERADAAVSLVTTALGGTVGVAATITKAKLQWCYEHIGIPTKQALTAYGLRRLFNGKTPEQMREQIRALPAGDPAKAMWVINKLFSGTFPNTSSGFSQATCSSLWDQFKARELQGYNADMEFLNIHRRTKPGEDPVVDAVRVKVAEAYQRAALRFIDLQVADAKGSWSV
jgi:hypothetical protein